MIIEKARETSQIDCFKTTLYLPLTSKSLSNKSYEYQALWKAAKIALARGSLAVEIIWPKMSLLLIEIQYIYRFGFTHLGSHTIVAKFTLNAGTSWSQPPT